MANPDLDNTRETITDELDVLADDIHTSDDGTALTFYIPTDQLDHAKQTLNGDVEVLETYDHEYLVKASPETVQQED